MAERAIRLSTRSLDRTRKDLNKSGLGARRTELAGPEAEQPCRRSIFVATLDARLIAIDAATGSPCSNFGKQGQVYLTVGVVNYEPGGQIPHHWLR